MKGSKVKSSSNKPFVKGGGGGMAPKGSAGPQKPGQSAQAGRGGGKFATGGKASMLGKNSGAAPAGKTAR